MEKSPQQGDVVVEQRGTGRAVRFDVGLFGGKFQYSMPTYEGALNRADSFARHHRVNVWFSEHGVYRLMTMRRTELSGAG
jgi:hypothetical protein